MILPVIIFFCLAYRMLIGLYYERSTVLLSSSHKYDSPCSNLSSIILNWLSMFILHFQNIHNCQGGFYH